MIVGLLGGLAVASLTGCQQAPRRLPDYPALRGETYTVNPPQAVFDASSMHPNGEADEGRAARDRPSPPWWVYRNDERLNVRRGAAQVAVTGYVVYTEDVQRSYDGEIRNRYRRERRSVEYGTQGR